MKDLHTKTIHELIQLLVNQVMDVQSLHEKSSSAQDRQANCVATKGVASNIQELAGAIVEWAEENEETKEQKLSRLKQELNRCSQRIKNISTDSKGNYILADLSESEAAEYWEEALIMSRLNREIKELQKISS